MQPAFLALWQEGDSGSDMVPDSSARPTVILSGSLSASHRRDVELSALGRLTRVLGWPSEERHILSHALTILEEELGWRGYWLPRLQERYGALASSIFLGLVWGLWHLPLALTPGDIRSGTFFGWTVLGTVATAVVFTWAYNHTGGSLLIALLFHTAINITGLFLAMSEVHPVTYLLLSWIVPLALLVRTRGRLGFEPGDGSSASGGREPGEGSLAAN